MPAFKSGFVALVGRPNAGKSTFINACLQNSLLPTSPVSQTTRAAVRVIITTSSSQIILVDTPGVHKPHDDFDAQLNELSTAQAKDADVIAFCLDSSAPFGRGDAYLLDELSDLKKPRMLLLTKCDVTDAKDQEAQIKAASLHTSFADVVRVSDKDRKSIDAALALFARNLPEGPQWFPDDMQVDADDALIVSGLIEEALFKNVRDEIPYETGVKIEDITYRQDGLIVIMATVMVNSLSQKKMIIGSGASRIKRIGMQARRKLEKALKARVYLDIVVKVYPHWRKKAH